ncbi:MAG: glycosyltransferase [Proteobacteria bacterium]|nr:glycosyltransferase [Pseudomonadota bacterium]
MAALPSSANSYSAWPAVAQLGSLLPARRWVEQQRPAEAWAATCVALRERPFHPEAWVFLAQLAARQGHHATAVECARRACQLAPLWKAAAEILSELATGPARPGPTEPPPVLPGLPAVPRLSVCLITRNEERHLPRCLHSIFELAHEIIVVDTGSTDATISLARSFGAQVRSVDWTDDFSAARNEALRDARGDWVLMLDADEELEDSGRARLAEELLQKGILGYRLPIVDAGREHESCHFVPRLFRNAPGLYYTGRIHEQIFPRVAALAQTWGMTQQPGRTLLRHYGYSPEETRRGDKVARNLRLIEQALIETPGDAQLLMQRGLELARSGRQSEALAQYRRAADRMAQLPAESITPEFRETLLMQHTTHLLAAGRLAELVALLQEPWTQPAALSASLSHVLGLACLKLGLVAEAVKHFRRTLARRHEPANGPFHPDIHTVVPQHCLAMSLAAAGDRRGADEAFTAALLAAPDSRAIWLDYGRFLAGHGQASDALRLCCRLAAEQPDDSAPWELGATITMRQPALHGLARGWLEEATSRFPTHAGFRQLHATLAAG